MNTVKNIGKNTIYLSIGELTSYMIILFLMTYAARVFGKDDFGLFSFGLSFSMIAVLFFDFGFYLLLVREIAFRKKDAEKFIVNSLIIKLAISAFIFIIIYLFANFMNYNHKTKEVIYVMSAFAFLSSFTQIFYSLFRGFENMFYDMLLKISRAVLLSVFGLYGLINLKGPVFFAMAFVFSEAAIVLTSVVIGYIKFNIQKLQFDYKIIKILLFRASPFMVATFFGSVYFYLNSIILERFHGEASVGIFSAANNLALAILFVPTVYTSAVYPVLSRFFGNSKEKMILIYERSFKYLYIVGLPISVGTFMLARKIILALYGIQYSESIAVLQIISVFIILKFINFLSGTVLSSINKQGNRMVSQGLTALFSIMINFALIPKMSYIGASIAIVLTEIALLVLYYSSVSAYFAKLNVMKILFKPLLAAGIMAAYLYIGLGNLFAQILIGGIIYIGALLVLKEFDQYDISLFNKLIRKSEA